jgi:biotin synthase
MLGTKAIVKRICIQTMNYPNVFKEIVALSSTINSKSNLPISISSQPFSKGQIQQLMNVGVDRIGISLDAATKELFKKIKGSMVGGPYVWERHLEGLKNAVQILGKGHVTTHFIVGLGETDYELIDIIQRMVNMGVHPSLFAFTPIPGTKQEKRSQPSLQRYRRIQLAHYLITKGQAQFDDLIFNSAGNIVHFKLKENEIRNIVKTGLPFMTSGCPGCNRPYYNEKPSGPLYNYPFNPTLKHLKKELKGE